MNVQPHKRGRGRPRTGGKREEILDAALALFAERGFHGTAIPDIATDAGIATGTIYRHFASKETLVNELYRRSKQALIDALTPEDLGGVGTPAASLTGRGGEPRGIDLRARFHDLWWRLVGFARDQPLAFAFLELHHHGTYLDAASRALELEILAPIAGVLESGRARGVTKPMPPHALIVTVWGAFVGLIKHARLGYYPLTDDICAQVEQTCWDAIASPGFAGARSTA